MWFRRAMTTSLPDERMRARAHFSKDKKEECYITSSIWDVASYHVRYNIAAGGKDVEGIRLHGNMNKKKINRKRGLSEYGTYTLVIFCLNQP